MVILFGVSVIQATLPIHMMATMPSVTPFEEGIFLRTRAICHYIYHFSLLGLVFLPHSIALFISHNVFGSLGFRLGRYVRPCISFTKILCGMLSDGCVLW